MASSRGTSNGPDWRDIAAALANYQSFTGVVFAVEFTAVEGAKHPDLVVTAHGYEKGKRAMGARPLASASVSCRQQDCTHVESVVMKALYDLDVVLYVKDLV